MIVLKWLSYLLSFYLRNFTYRNYFMLVGLNLFLYFSSLVVLFFYTYCIFVTAWFIGFNYLVVFLLIVLVFLFIVEYKTSHSFIYSTFFIGYLCFIFLSFYLKKEPYLFFMLRRFNLFLYFSSLLVLFLYTYCSFITAWFMGFNCFNIILFDYFFSNIYIIKFSLSLLLSLNFVKFFNSRFFYSLFSKVIRNRFLNNFALSIFTFYFVMLLVNMFHFFLC